MKNLPIEATLIEIHITAEELKKANVVIEEKVEAIKDAVDWEIPQGIAYINGQWQY